MIARASVILAMLPVAIYGTIWTEKKTIDIVRGPPIYEDTVHIIPVRTEGIRRIDMDTRTFNARWRVVNDMPPMHIAGRKPGEATPLPTPRPQPEKVTAPVTPKRARVLHRDICGRHGMHKVWVNSKRWRCRK